MNAERTTVIYHLALRDEWQTAVDAGEPYRRSTIGRSLDDEGFIHCSFEDQVQATADRSYAGRSDVLVLVIDSSKLASEVRVENGFPHVYGPLPLEAVMEVRPLEKEIL